MNVGNKIKELRMEKEITQEELAKAIGVSRQTIVSIEAKQSIPKLESAHKLAEYFDKSIEEIFQFNE